MQILSLVSPDGHNSCLVAVERFLHASKLTSAEESGSPGLNAIERIDVRTR
jgi:hypothetical protein